MHLLKLNAKDLKIILLTLTTVAVLPGAEAQKLYKVVDENGRVSYQDIPPQTDSGSVEERHVNTSTNKLSLTPSRNKAASKAETARNDDSDASDSDELAADDTNIDANEEAAQRPDLASQQTRDPVTGDPDRTADGDQSASVSDPDQQRPVDPDGEPPVSPSIAAEGQQTADGSEPQIKILEADQSQSSAATNDRPNSRGRRPAPKPVDTDEQSKPLTTEELTDIARSLRNK